MGWKFQVLVLILTSDALLGCARERRELPALAPSVTASERASVERSRIQAELSALSESAARDSLQEQGDLQEQLLERKSQIAELSFQLQSLQAEISAWREIVESRNQKEIAARQEQMRELAASIRINDERVQSRRQELWQALGPTGTAYEGNESLNALRAEVEALQSSGTELRSAYASLADENRSAIIQRSTDSTKSARTGESQARSAELGPGRRAI